MPAQATINEFTDVEMAGLNRHNVKLNKNMRDLNVSVSNDGLKAENLTELLMKYMYGGVKATHGVKSGKAYFALRITKMGECGVVRVGWTASSEHQPLGGGVSFAIESTGNFGGGNLVRPYGAPLHTGDTVGCYLDLNKMHCCFTFSINGEKYAPLDFKLQQEQDMYPCVFIKDSKIELNFGQDQFGEPNYGYSFMNAMKADEISFLRTTQRQSTLIFMCGNLREDEKADMVKDCLEDIETNPDENQVVVLGSNVLKRQISLPTFNGLQAVIGNMTEKQLHRLAVTTTALLIKSIPKQNMLLIVDESNAVYNNVHRVCKRMERLQQVEMLTLCNF